MRGAAIRSQIRLSGQAQPVTAAIAFGFVDPARKAGDARFVREVSQPVPVEHDIRPGRLLVFANQQGAEARGGLPCDRAAGISRSITAEVMHVVACGMQARLRLFA